MTTATFKKAIKDMMKSYKFSLDQAVWSIRKMNPEYEILINEASLILETEKLMGRI